ncbi:MAG TPA: hypothetical protein VM008_07690 [Phycisphaerae bacterium]|nr:hypothetical protein [Phycisphaerae bacterium]
MLHRNFLDFIALLEARHVKYLVIGGYAVSVHGFPRHTGDLDIYVAVSPENAVRLPEVFRDFGFGDLDISAEDFLREDFVVEIGREPMKIQVLTGIDGVRFDEAYEDRIVVKEDGLPVPFIGLKSLLKNKEASPRPKDRIDLEALREANAIKHRAPRRKPRRP